jgi:cytoskeleton protein RodZ
MIENEEIQQIETVIQGPGQILKQARERANFSSQDIADKMKLRKSLIEDIEQDNYDINISLTFIRGYLKLYAKHVKVAEIDVLNAFENLNPQKKEPAKLQSFPRRVTHQANDDKLMLVTYLIVAAVIALVVIWWVQQSPTVTWTEINVNNYTESTTSDTVVQEILTPEGTLVANAAPLSTSLDTTDDPGASQSDGRTTAIIEEQSIDNQSIDNQSIGNQSVDAQIMDDTAVMDKRTDVAESAVSESILPVELIFEFSGDCWMNLSDATGENIAYGVKVKGRIMPVTGIPPFIVTLGAPEVVEISYAGESLNMSFLPSGRIAKFDLPLSE